MNADLPPKLNNSMKDIDALREAVAAGWQLYDDPAKIVARYKDRDFADQVPRAVIYFDIGILAGTIAKLQQEKANGKA